MDPTEENIISVLNWIGGLVCHQRAERTLKVGGLYLPVCARDTGIYSGLLLGYLLLPLRNKRSHGLPDLFISFAMILPLIIDSLTQTLGFRASMNEIRLISGLFFGTALSPLLIYLLATLPASRKIPLIRSFTPENVEIDSKRSWMGRKTLILGSIFDLAIEADSIEKLDFIIHSLIVFLFMAFSFFAALALSAYG